MSAPALDMVLYERLMTAESTADTAMAIASAGDKVASLPVDTMEAVFGALTTPATASATIHLDAQLKVLQHLPSILTVRKASVGAVLDFYQRVIKFGGDTADPKVFARRQDTMGKIGDIVANLVRTTEVKTADKKMQSICLNGPFSASAAVVAALGEKGIDGDDMKACVANLAGVPAAQYETLPRDTLCRLIAASTKSTCVSDTLLSVVATACAASLPQWSVDEVCKLLLALSKSKGGEGNQGVANLFSSASAVVSPQLASLSGVQLIKVLLAVGAVPAVRSLFETAAAEAANKAEDMPEAQLLLLTQGLAPLGGENPCVQKVLGRWCSELPDTDLSADQLAKLAAVLAPVAASHTTFWETLGKQLSEEQGNLTAPGFASLETAFGNGGGPDFADKKAILSVLKKNKKGSGGGGDRSRSRGRGDDRGRDRDDDRGRDRDDRGRDRDRDRDDRRDRDRRDDRDRGRDRDDRGRGRDDRRKDSRDRRRR
eukprot:gnl/MRDRNA2_/MRDRNA2_29779_c0_seq1.p1 gnl/MRDRNA2_/MRDRNA2_29779_c0~~gnl/MRDRNA2_/MRDRNA2_29779_c0_seq1.p1  ORF type:complete len:487 (-),score=84.27 gnl/MRDRNA2_/MRDRNA2_29779_c0_seq1:40-1500(-)